MTHPGPDSGPPVVLEFTGVTMERTAGGPPTAVSGLTVHLDADGLTLSRPRSGTVRRLSWADMGSPRCGAQGILPDGSPAVALSATVDGQLLRWLVPAAQLPPGQAAALDQAMAEMLLPTPDAVAPTALTEPSSSAASAAASPNGDDPAWWASQPSLGPPRSAPRHTSPRHSAPRHAAPSDPQLSSADPAAVTWATPAARRSSARRPRHAAASSELGTPLHLDPPSPAPFEQTPPAQFEPPLPLQFEARSPAQFEPSPPAPFDPSPAQFSPPPPYATPPPAAFAPPPPYPGSPTAPPPYPGSLPYAAPPPYPGSLTAPPPYPGSLPYAAPPPYPGSLPYAPPAYGPQQPYAAPPPYWYPAPAPAGRSRRPWVIGAVVLVLVAGAVAIPLAIGSTAPGRNQTGLPGEHEVAAQANLSRSDLPSGWTVAPPGGPLGNIFGSPGRGPALTPAQQQAAVTIAHRYEQCVGVSGSKDRIFGSKGPTPAAQVSSPVFAGPSSGPAMLAGSRVAVYASSTPVESAMAQITRPEFPQCFGAALGQEIVLGAKAGVGPTGVVFGTPEVQPLTVPKTAGADAAGVDVIVPLSGDGTSSSVQVGAVIVAGGRLEADLVTYGGPSGFPSTLTGKLAWALERHVVTEGTATGV